VAQSSLCCDVQGWTPAEEEGFLAGLETHGRNWKAIAADLGTRDSRAVASHAQKHFIRLCMSGTSLPVRVLESGAGYTLSGNLLDPNSAAAAAYGFSYDLLLERE
jgi:protein MYSM1